MPFPDRAPQARRPTGHYPLQTTLPTRPRPRVISVFASSSMHYRIDPNWTVAVNGELRNFMVTLHGLF